MLLCSYKIVLCLLMLTYADTSRYFMKPNFPNYCRNKDKCKPACNCEVYPNCSVLPMEETVRKTILFYHNQIRDIQSAGNPQPSGMTMLQYDMQLEEISRCWVARCDNEYSNCFKTSKFSETSQAVGGLILEKEEKPNVFLWLQMMSYWLGQAEIVSPGSIHNLPSGDKYEGMHNFAQLMSDGILLVGCAWSLLKTDNWLIFVCSYGPRGPLPGESVYKTGFPCSRCPVGFNCDYMKPFERLCKPKAKEPQPPKSSTPARSQMRDNQDEKYEMSTLKDVNKPPKLPYMPHSSRQSPSTTSTQSFYIPQRPPLLPPQPIQNPIGVQTPPIPQLPTSLQPPSNVAPPLLPEEPSPMHPPQVPQSPSDSDPFQPTFKSLENLVPPLLPQPIFNSRENLVPPLLTQPIFKSRQNLVPPLLPQYPLYYPGDSYPDNSSDTFFGGATSVSVGETSFIYQPPPQQSFQNNETGMMHYNPPLLPPYPLEAVTLVVQTTLHHMAPYNPPNLPPYTSDTQVPETNPTRTLPTYYKPPKLPPYPIDTFTHTPNPIENTDTSMTFDPSLSQRNPIKPPQLPPFSNQYLHTTRTIQNLRGTKTPNRDISPPQHPPELIPQPPPLPRQPSLESFESSPEPPFIQPPELVPPPNDDKIPELPAPPEEEDYISNEPPPIPSPNYQGNIPVIPPLLPEWTPVGQDTTSTIGSPSSSIQEQPPPLPHATPTNSNSSVVSTEIPPAPPEYPDLAPPLPPLPQEPVRFSNMLPLLPPTTTGVEIIGRRAHSHNNACRQEQQIIIIFLIFFPLKISENFKIYC